MEASHGEHGHVYAKRPLGPQVPIGLPRHPEHVRVQEAEGIFFLDGGEEAATYEHVLEMVAHRVKDLHHFTVHEVIRLGAGADDNTVDLGDHFLVPLGFSLGGQDLGGQNNGWRERFESRGQGAARWLQLGRGQ